MKVLWGLRSRLLGGLAVLVIAAVTTSGWMALTIARKEMIVMQDNHALAFGGQVAELIARANPQMEELSGDVTQHAVQRVTSSLLRIHGVLEITVVDHRGIAIVGKSTPDLFLLGRRIAAPIAHREGGDILIYAPIRSSIETVGIARIKMSGEDDLSAALGRAWAVLLALTGFNVGLVLVFGAVFIRRVVGPIEALAQQAERVAAGDLNLAPVPMLDAEANDEVGHLTIAFNRMTASLRAQRETMAAQDKLATVGRLAAGVAHEVGNPLTAILGYVDLMAGEPERPDDPDAAMRKDSLARIRKETTRISAIIADLLDYSRPVSGEIEAVSLVEIVEHAHSMMRPQTRFRGVELVRRLPADLPAVRASSSRLSQVLVNLFFNAGDAMNGDGVVTVAARTEGDRVVVTISDTGPGVARDDRAKIFDPFFSTKEPGKGTGLGLAISLSIVEAFGGTLRLIDSADAKGATFELRLLVAD